jgi:anti-sigma factor ChrR (cupin superfamily)
MPPNATIPRHAHLCERFEIILEGSLLVEDGVLLGPGDVMVARSGEQYGPHTAGPDGCRTLEVFSRLAGAHHQIQETPQGPLEIEFGSFAALEKVGAGARHG